MWPRQASRLGIDSATDTDGRDRGIKTPLGWFLHPPKIITSSIQYILYWKANQQEGVLADFFLFNVQMTQAS